MDPKTLSNSDPQITDAYNHVMGTPTTGIEPQQDTFTTTTTQTDTFQNQDGLSSSPLSAAPIQTENTPSAFQTADTVPSTDFQNTSFATDTPAVAPASLTPLPTLSQTTTETITTEQPPAPAFPAAPTDFSAEAIQTTTETLSAPIESDPQPSIFSTDPNAPDTTNQSAPATTPSAFFTDTTPENTITNPEQQATPDAFAPLAPMEPPADTAMATDAPGGPTPVTPYTTPQQENQPQAPSSFPQPLPSPSEVVNASTPHETSAITKVIYIIAAVIFFTVYTIFWIKVFNIPFIF